MLDGMRGYREDDFTELEDLVDWADSRERRVLEAEAFPVLEDELDDPWSDGYTVVDVSDEAPHRYRVKDSYAKRGKVDGSYDWPVLHGHDRVPDTGVGVFPHYFVVEDDERDQEERYADIIEGEYAAAIDHRFKYIGIPEENRQKPVVDALDRFAIAWDNNTRTRGTYRNTGDEDVDLDHAKFLE